MIYSAITALSAIAIYLESIISFNSNQLSFLWAINSHEGFFLIGQTRGNEAFALSEDFGQKPGEIKYLTS